MKSIVDELALKAFSVAAKSAPDSLLVKLLTNKEKVALGRRLIIAEAIKAGKTRMEINERISISPNTFTQIKRWIDSDQNGSGTVAVEQQWPNLCQICHQGGNHQFREHQQMGHGSGGRDERRDAGWRWDRK